MNLFELNARMAVKLNQSLETIYDMEYMEYSYLLNIVKKDIEDKKAGNSESGEPVPNVPVMVNLPDHLKFR
jgi:hypothetical protein